MLEAVQASVVRAEWPPVVFADSPRRAGLLELVSADLPATPVRIHVHRNQPLEVVASCAEAFLRAGWDPTFTYGDYDDSLSFDNRAAAGIEFLHLRGMTDAPILVACNLDLSYLASLRIELTFSMDPVQECASLHGFLRLTEAEVARRLAGAAYRRVAVSLRDRLSDSGTIAATFTRCAGETILVEEISTSCRALGRGIEDVMITEALRGIAGACGGVSGVVFGLVAGPRNAPAGACIEPYTAGRCTTLPVSPLWKTP